MATTDTETATGTLGELYLLADELQAALDELLDHSKINYNDINRRRSGVVFVGWNPHCWEELDGAGQRALGDARRLDKLWRELAGKAIATGAPERGKQFESAERTLDHVLRRVSGARAGAPASTIERTREKVAEALAKQRAVLADLPTAHGDGGRMLVPDTNAMLYQPAIEDWRPGGDPWTAVIFPQVVRELDELKISGRGIADVAGSCIRRLKEYGGRGDTFAGVSLGPGSRLREVAIDADMSDTLSWLRAGNNDDELLASVFELKWQDLSADVVVVTRDRNLQNKAASHVSHIWTSRRSPMRARRPHPSVKPGPNRRLAIVSRARCHSPAPSSVCPRPRPRRRPTGSPGRSRPHR